MSEEIVELTEDVSHSPLYSEDLAPVPKTGRTWSVWSLAALWVGMAVCIPTYMLASSIILNGISWIEAIVIIGLANLIITVPMVLSGHAGVKYGIPFPVLGRSSFGYNGIHLPALIRGLIAAVWFGIQCWIGGISIYSIYCALSGVPITMELDVGKFICFFIFWLMNVYFIVKGTESIKLLEMLAAPILVLMGVALIAWGTSSVGGFGKVLDQVDQLKAPGAVLEVHDNSLVLTVNPIRNIDNQPKAEHFQYTVNFSGKPKTSEWIAIQNNHVELSALLGVDVEAIKSGKEKLSVQLRKGMGDKAIFSKSVKVSTPLMVKDDFISRIWPYLVMLTAMVGFWATMSISIADITRYSKSQKDQIKGQFIGLPGTMILYSFVGIFVTAASVVLFEDVLLRDDAPWDPAALLAKFDGITVVIVSQVFLLIATLSTNIAANVIAPANAFSNAFPKKINFKSGGLITAIIGIAICPWWIINHIIPFLLFVSSLLGPVVAILICDYFVIRKTKLNLPGLYKTDGEYAFGKNGIHSTAMLAFFAGVVVSGVGYFYEPLHFLYDISWFSGFITSFVLYYFLMRNKTTKFSS